MPCREFRLPREAGRTKMRAIVVAAQRVESVCDVSCEGDRGGGHLLEACYAARQTAQ